MTLPDDFLVRRCIDHWVIVGPTGLFVVGRSNGDAHAAARRASILAQQVRTRLADVVSWVPFVNAVLVAERDRHDLSCPVVDLDGLGALLRDDTPRIDPASLPPLRHHVPGVVQAIELDDAAVSR